ncbi:unnamed protein product [Cladocopium goreaui]|uniref:Uncharacterized protein n=1 Tax=Cladocopium goreaui TaxID=2562237 RepID=A0A9P1GEJ3_9DINO|nr:unnamed protein product [Cladocopium goreaui]
MEAAGSKLFATSCRTALAFAATLGFAFPAERSLRCPMPSVLQMCRCSGAEVLAMTYQLFLCNWSLCTQQIIWALASVTKVACLEDMEVLRHNADTGYLLDNLETILSPCRVTPRIVHVELDEIRTHLGWWNSGVFAAYWVFDGELQLKNSTIQLRKRAAGM